MSDATSIATVDASFKVSVSVLPDTAPDCTNRLLAAPATKGPKSTVTDEPSFSVIVRLLPDVDEPVMYLSYNVDTSNVNAEPSALVNVAVLPEMAALAVEVFVTAAATLATSRYGVRY